MKEKTLCIIVKKTVEKGVTTVTIDHLGDESLKGEYRKHVLKEVLDRLYSGYK